MSIQAKVTPIDQSISSAAAVEVPENGILKLSQSSNIALDVAPESVAGYSKSGSDLIVQLKTGESVRIANFYAEGQPSSQLFLADKDKLVAVDLPPVAADGPLMAGYIPQESLAGFESLTGADGRRTDQQRRRWRRRFFGAPGHHSAEGGQRPEDSA